MLPYTKNPNYIPHSYTKTKPFSFTFYNPYTNTIPNARNVNSSVNLYIGQANFENKFNTRRFSHCLCSHTGQQFEHKEYMCNYSVLNDVSQDSAICMDDNFYDYTSLPDESCNSSEFSIARSDSAVDMTATKFSSITRKTNGSYELQQTGFPVTSTMLDMHSISVSSLLLNDHQIETNISNGYSNDNINAGDMFVQGRLSSFKSSTLCKKKISQYMNKQSPDREAPLSKFGKSLQNSQSSMFLSKKIVTPRRYIKWQKAKSCIAIHKINSSDKFKLKKIHSHPSLLKECDSGVYDSSSYDSSGSITGSKSFLSTSKLSSSILSKISNFNFPPVFKQYVLVGPCEKVPENHPKQKYTPLPSPLPVPAMVAKLSNSEYGSRNTFTTDNSYSNVSSKYCILKGDHMKLEKQEDKPVSLVLLLF